MGRKSDKHQLLYLLKETEEILNAAIDEKGIVLPKYLRESITAAWPEVSSALCAAKEELSKHWAQCRPFLQRAGLMGKQLGLKMAAFEDALWKWKREKAYWHYRAVLKFINILLGSLARVPPIGPFMEMVKEFKEIIEATMLPETPFEPDRPEDCRGKRALELACRDDS